MFQKATSRSEIGEGKIWGGACGGGICGTGRDNVAIRLDGDRCGSG